MGAHDTYMVGKGLSCYMEWIRRSLNDKADYISHIVEFDDWQLQIHIFSIRWIRFGAIDLFASDYTMLSCLGSMDLSCEAVDILELGSWLVGATIAFSFCALFGMLGIVQLVLPWSFRKSA